MEYASIGHNSRKRRDEIGITQEALAEMVELSTSYMGAIERGEKLPKLTVFIRIANALEISADRLLSGVLTVGNEIVASDLSKQIAHLPSREQRRILKVVQAMIADQES